MNYYTCFYRHRDNSDNIIGYTLRNEETYKWMQVTPLQLKEAISAKRVHVFNLKLTSDGRLIESNNNLKVTGKTNTEMLARNEIVNDTDDLGYTKNQIKEKTLETRVKHDNVFETNKLFRFIRKLVDNSDKENKARNYKQSNSNWSGEEGTDFAGYNTEFDGDYDVDD